jgi:hypothetical protein
MVQRSPLGEMLGSDGMQFNLETAVAKYAGGGDLPSGADTT